MADWQIADRLALPEPLTGARPVRFEHQHWQRLDRAEGELEIGYDAAGRPVRIEYHWKRYFSRANPAVADVYTAELWVRERTDGWLYLVQPGQPGFVSVPHAPLRALLKEHLNIDIGD
jgi:hypothetical protein